MPVSFTLPECTLPESPFMTVTSEGAVACADVVVRPSENPVPALDGGTVPSECGNPMELIVELLAGHEISSAPVTQSSLPSWHRAGSLLYVRRSHRVPLVADVCIHGLDDRMQPVTEPLVVTGRDVSAGGIAFLHQHPLPFRRVAVTLPTARGMTTVIVRLTWCRFSGQGRYVSGGRIIRTQSEPLAVPEDWSALDRA